MEIKSRIALGILALAVSCSAALAQSQQQNPPPPQQGQAQSGPGNGASMRPREPMGPGDGPMGRQGFRGGPMDRLFGRRGPMGMHGRGMGTAGFGGEAGFLNNPATRQRLGVTADQTAKIHQQELEFQKSQIRDWADLQVKRIELNELLAADNPDRSAINAKLQEVSAAQMASEKAAIDNRLTLRDILTPAQRQQLQQLRTNVFQPGDAASQTPTRPAGRGGRDPAQRGAPAPGSPQGQAPPNQ
jgi:Spy/CpxP family protein refolding chaperone